MAGGRLTFNAPSTYGQMEGRGEEAARPPPPTGYRPCSKCGQSFVISVNEVEDKVIKCPQCRDQEEMEPSYRGKDPDRVAVMKLKKPKLTATDRIAQRHEELDYHYWMSQKAATKKERKMHADRVEKMRDGTPGWEPPERPEVGVTLKHEKYTVRGKPTGTVTVMEANRPDRQI